MAAMLLSGIGMGVVFDGYRVVSDELRINRWWIPVFDLLYWIAATIVVFHVLSANNEGEVRLYVFIGLLCGIGLYYWVFSKIVVKLVHIAIETVRALIRFSIRAFRLLVVQPLMLVFRLLKVIFAFFIALTLFLSKIVVQLVRPFWLLLRWMLRPLLRPLGRRMAKLFGPLLDRLKLRARAESARVLALRLWRLIRRKKD